MSAKSNSHRNKKPDYSSAKINEETSKSIKNAFTRVKSDTEKDEKGNFIPLYKNGDFSADFTKILMIQQAVSGSLREGASLLSRNKVPRT